MTIRLSAALRRAPAFARSELVHAHLLMVLIAAAVILIAMTQVRAETCLASHYGVGDGLHGRRTASGERFNAHGLTAAHRTRRMGSLASVCHGPRCVSVRINDRGPFVRGRCVDLSYGAARAIGCGGTCKVEVR